MWQEQDDLIPWSQEQETELQTLLAIYQDPRQEMDDSDLSLMRALDDVRVRAGLPSLIQAALRQTVPGYDQMVQAAVADMEAELMGEAAPTTRGRGDI